MRVVDMYEVDAREKRVRDRSAGQVRGTGS